MEQERNDNIVLHVPRKLTKVRIRAGFAEQ
jgi:hypothetical protein